MKKWTNYMLPVGIVSLIFCAIQNFDLAFGFLFAILFGIVAMKREGFSVRTTLQSLFREIFSYWHIYVIVLFLGMNIAGWMSSGILAQLMVIGLKGINGDNFLFISLFLTTVVSLFMGTGLGTLSTIGLVFWGIGKSLGFSSQIVLGMLISGAYVADVASPMSLLLNLNLEANQITYRNYIKKFLPFLLGGLLISYGLYSLILRPDTVGMGIQEAQLQSQIQQGFHLHPIMLLVPLLNIFLALKGVSLSLNFLTSISIGSLFSIFFQRTGIVQQLKYLIFGYENIHLPGQIGELFKGGGMMNTATIVFIIGLALGFSHLLNLSGTLKRLKEKFLRGNSKIQTTIGTAVFSIFMTSVGCDQSLGILVPSKETADTYEKWGYSREQLAAHISASGVIIAPLEPWNVNALIIYGFSGVSALSYGPYTFLCFLMPLWMVFYVFVTEKRKESADIKKEKRRA